MVFERIVETFRFNYEYEIEYGYDFSDLGSLVQITNCHTSLVSGVSLSAGKQREAVRSRVLEMRLI